MQSNVNQEQFATAKYVALKPNSNIVKQASIVTYADAVIPKQRTSSVTIRIRSNQQTKRILTTVMVILLIYIYERVFGCPNETQEFTKKIPYCWYANKCNNVLINKAWFAYEWTVQAS